MIGYRVLLKKFITSLFLVFVVLFLSFLFYGQLYGEPGPEITAESALVMEAETGKILWEKNSYRRMYPASTTKMLTAIIAIETVGDLSQVAEISENADGRNHSAFTFKRGDKVSVLDLLKAALICSHNNATIALAEHISGSEEEFVKVMNKKAKEIGANNTYFQNTNGLDSVYPLHMSTAKDLAVIAKYCLNNPLFSQIVDTDQDTITVSGRQIEIINIYDLLQFDYIKGIKTGFTARAGFCIVTYSDSDRLDLITVILNSTRESREEDAISLIEYVNQNYNFEQIVDHKLKIDTVSAGGLSQANIDVYPSQDYHEFINTAEDKVDFQYSIEEQIELPVQKNQDLGRLSVYINDQMVREVSLVSNESVENPVVEQNLNPANQQRDKKIMIFALGFYFFIFIFIIIKNLFFKTKFYV